MLPRPQQIAGKKTSGNIVVIYMFPVFSKNVKREQHRYLNWQFHENNGPQTLCWGKWKSVKLNVNNNPTSPMELFDLDVDPGEEFNVADKYPEVVKKMERFMQEAHTKNPNWPLLPGEK